MALSERQPAERGEAALGWAAIALVWQPILGPWLLGLVRSLRA